VPKDDPIMLDGVGLDPAGFECDLFLRALQASSRAGRP
jgi:hypothetical protein